MNNTTGYLCVIGTADVKKDDRNVDDSKGYFTLYRTGTASG